MRRLIAISPPRAATTMLAVNVPSRVSFRAVKEAKPDNSDDSGGGNAHSLVLGVLLVNDVVRDKPQKTEAQPPPSVTLHPFSKSPDNRDYGGLKEL